MTTRTSPWSHGIPCWVDLRTPDVEGSVAFYSAVLGWQVPRGRDGEDVVAEVAGAAAAGIGLLREEAGAGWLVHLATDDVDATTAAAAAAGGTVLAPPAQAGPLARSSTVADPLGARVGLWQAGTMIGSSFVNEPGGLCWEELRSPDPTASRAFYGALFDYAFEMLPQDGPDYAAFHLAGDQVHLGAVRAVEDDGIPPRWLPFFGVPDAHTAGELAAASGGSIVQEAFWTANGTMAALADPQGAQFWVVTSTGDGQPDRTG